MAHQDAAEESPPVATESPNQAEKPKAGWGFSLSGTINSIKQAVNSTADRVAKRIMKNRAKTWLDDTNPNPRSHGRIMKNRAKTWLDDMAELLHGLDLAPGFSHSKLKASP